MLILNTPFGKLFSVSIYLRCVREYSTLACFYRRLTALTFTVSQTTIYQERENEETRFHQGLRHCRRRFYSRHTRFQHQHPRRQPERYRPRRRRRLSRPGRLAHTRIRQDAERRDRRLVRC